MIWVLIGVAGSGKTSVGEALSAALGVRFEDADRLHPPANIEKMARGEPLDDQDRAPWIEEVVRVIRTLERDEGGGVVACSALKRAHRRQLAQAGRVTFIYLRVDRGVLDRRLRSRRGHFFGAELLDSQLESLEEPSADEAWVIDPASSPEGTAARIVERMKDSALDE